VAHPQPQVVVPDVVEHVLRGSDQVFDPSQGRSRDVSRAERSSIAFTSARENGSTSRNRRATSQALAAGGTRRESAAAKPADHSFVVIHQAERLRPSKRLNRHFRPLRAFR
jgi:hypothetical protein